MRDEAPLQQLSASCLQIFSPFPPVDTFSRSTVNEAIFADGNTTALICRHRLPVHMRPSSSALWLHIEGNFWNTDCVLRATYLTSLDCTLCTFMSLAAQLNLHLMLFYSFLIFLSVLRHDKREGRETTVFRFIWRELKIKVPYVRLNPGLR